MIDIVYFSYTPITYPNNKFKKDNSPKVILGSGTSGCVSRIVYVLAGFIPACRAIDNDLLKPDLP